LRPEVDTVVGEYGSRYIPLTVSVTGEIVILRLVGKSGASIEHGRRAA